MKIFDLSHTITKDTPVYPGDPPLKIEPAGVLERDGYCDHYVSIGTHVGTHIDGPMHMLESIITLDQIPVERFIGRGRLVDVTNEFDIGELKKLDLQAGDIVLLKTGMSTKYQDASYFEEYPVMSEEYAKYLVEKKVSMVGFDTCSPDNAEDFPIHKILLGGDVLIIENLTKLDQLNSVEDFTVYALPVKLSVDGAPARVIARTV